jgi:uncharacterized protein YbcI
MTNSSRTVESLLGLAQSFLSEWQQIRNIQTGRASAVVGAHHIGVLLEDAFTSSELILAEREAGLLLLHEFVEPIVNLISEELTTQIEWAVGRRVVKHKIILQVKAGYLIILFSLSDETVNMIEAFSSPTWMNTICR